MRGYAIVSLLLGLAVTGPAAIGQQGSSNPFGDPFGADPFGGQPAGDEQAGDDPFGGSDPFGGKPKNGADPFSDKNPKARARRAAAAATPAAATAAAAPRPHTPTEAEERIRSELGEKTVVSFIETPLEDVVRFIAEKHDIPVIVDQRAMEEIGLSTDVPITMDLRNVSLRSTLKLILRDLDMTYVVKDEVLMVTTVEAAEKNLILKTYKFPDDLSDRGDKIIEVLTATVHPDQWAQLGGPCSIGVIDNVLFISSSETVHESVEDFMTKLMIAYERRALKNRDAPR